MADNDRRAEIEAVARELWPGAEGGPVWPSALRRSEKVVAALDRVRDARGDDENHGPTFADWKKERAARSPQDEGHEAERAPECPSCGQRYTVNGPAWDGKRCDACLYRSPQGEDHETARPEQPPPDALGGQPPAEPPEAP